MQRRDILAVHVAADPALASDLAVFLMVEREAGYFGERNGSSLVAMAPSDPVPGFRTPDAAAAVAREQAGQALDRSWVAAETRAGRFDAFRALPHEARAAWLGHAVARTLEASLNHSGARACAFTITLGSCSGSMSRPGGGRPAPTISTECPRACRWRLWRPSADRPSRLLCQVEEGGAGGLLRAHLRGEFHRRG
jgi:hypothetical protein